MNITETNKKFAEFAGLTSEWGIFKFESDWNALMLVVNKIEESKWVDMFITKCDTNLYTIKIGITWRYSYIPIEVIKHSKIEAVYEACEMFIDYYNKQKP